ncbi:cytochrome BD ubiquinol oxidase subunit II [Sorangium cellulosum]|uniref:Cytochrome BD ubiquinol oxidase subunit II n=1 Tax=Sorangium cellulosum TaxID=56 RepID=A0A4P2PXW1_SORCE|nr:cytochrome d ubiquinol oxidase subunit II [Sorangium cellulosum]AUX21674.1 cytochrome BD ubiquinol oxidase subunit II [Sorangium cellulosum]
MHPEWLVGGVMVAALVLYALLGGADFGGGVWDLLASGPRKREQRALIERVMGPIWEANHVWLILAVVLLFTAFPPAFAAISVALHVPLTLFLLGVVFRGSAFSFRSYDARGDRQQKRWGFVFSLASVIAPLLLGMIVGAVASGRIRVASGVVTSGFFAPWLSLFPVVVGLFALSLFAYLAAVYLTNEATDPALVDDFRRRALASGCVVAGLALASFAASFEGAPLIREGLTDHPITWPLHVTTGLAATAAFVGLWTRRYGLARVAAAAQVALILLGWAASQYPYLVVPDVTVEGAAANPVTLRLVLWALGAGSLLLFPSLYVLFRVFGSGRAGAASTGAGDHERE